MRKKVIICLCLMLILLTVCLQACSLFTSYSESDIVGTYKAGYAYSYNEWSEYILVIKSDGTCSYTYEYNNPAADRYGIVGGGSKTETLYEGSYTLSGNTIKFGSYTGSIKTEEDKIVIVVGDNELK